MERLLSFFTVIALAMTLLACGTEESAPARVRIVSHRLSNGEIPLARGESVLIGIEAFDADGERTEPDPDCVSWSSVDPHAIAVEPRTPSAQAFAQAAWFDHEPAEDAGMAELPDGGMVETFPYGREPESIVTADVCGITDSILVRSIIDVSGTWQVDVGDGLVQTAVLSQDGRIVNYVAADGIEVVAGEVRGDTITIMLSGFDLRGRITSPNKASGTVIGVPSPEGDWSAVRHTTPTLNTP